MATKYEVLEALIDAQTAWLGEVGSNDVVAGVVRIIGESHGDEEDLAEAIYDYIAECFTPSREEANGSG